MADNYMDNIQMGKDEDAESFALHDLEAREKIDELDGLIAEAKDLINTLQTTQDRMQSTIASAQASIADNAAAITTNQTAIASINNDLSDLYYHIGDSIDYSSNGTDNAIGIPGTIQTNGTALSCLFPLSKPIGADVTGTKIENVTILGLMSIEGRLIYSDSEMSKYTFTAEILDGVLRIIVRLNEGTYGATIYTPIYLQICMKITFS